MIIRIILASLFLMGSLSAQNFIGKLSSSNKIENKVISDSVRILAVMVEFQADKDDATFGTGKFGSIYSQDYADTILDPLPHDVNYFNNHLEFVKNYYNKASNGMLAVDYNVLPDIITVSKTMRNYTPPVRGEDFTNLGTFASEVWTKVDSAYQNINFTDYDVFIIFHAGVGRDISLPGSLGIERDLPSVYLGLRSLQNIYGSEFTGFVLPISGQTITNTMIIPETESRELSSLGQTFLFEISINGLLVSSIASHIGLPDLFDTETGLSAIGRFGLMDGQSIFAYSGLFPPEPSAWEKIYLGWVTPVEIKPQDFNTRVSLTAELASNLNDTTIVKIPINSSEYYLVENRQRDVFADGINVKYVVGTDTLTKNFPKDTTGFRSYEISEIDGVVIDVDEFDWAVPGNGIVIWHIDENVINEKIDDNKINSDINRRGVDVEEADGIQDIGVEFQTIFGDVVVGEGEPNDFWFAGNDSELFENSFTPYSRPDTRANDGTNSFIAIREFTESEKKMAFLLTYGSNQIHSLSINQLSIPINNVKLNASSDSSFNMISGTTLYRYNPYSQNIDSLLNFSSFKTSSYVSGNATIIFGAIANRINYFSSGLINVDTLVTREINDSITTSPINYPMGVSSLLVGTSRGVYKVRPGSINFIEDSLIINKVVKKIAGGSYYSFITEKGNDGISFYDVDGNKINLDNENPIDIVVEGAMDEFKSVVLTENNKVFVIDRSGSFNKFTLNSTTPVRQVILADLKNDGNNYIVYSSGNMINAVNFTGAQAENFPVNIHNKTTKDFLLTASNVLNKINIVAFTKDGGIYFIDGITGRIIDEYTTSMGSDFAAVPVISYKEGQLFLSALNIKGEIYNWKFVGGSNSSTWTEENGNTRNNSLVSKANTSNAVTEFFPAARTYNYPNPVYENETFIRYFVGKDAKINIKIYDLAGDLITELNNQARGGFDNETRWDVTNVASGIYIARVEASSEESVEYTTIKIAVIK